MSEVSNSGSVATGGQPDDGRKSPARAAWADRASSWLSWRARTTRIGRATSFWLVVLIVAVGVGAAAAYGRTLGLALAGVVLLVGILMADPLVLVVLALPGALLVFRVGGSGTNLSGADALVFVGAVVSFFLFVEWRKAPTLRRFLRGLVWFEAVLLLVVLAHPNRYDIVEWFHRWSYLGGSVLVGWVIATQGRVRQAVRLYFWGASLIAVIAIGLSAAKGFAPAQWGQYQKNAIGTIMLVAILVTLVNPPWMEFGRREVQVYRVLCIGGMLASQSRQAIVVLILGVIFIMLLNPELRRRAKIMLLGSIPLAIFLYFSFTTQFRVNPKFNSVTVRLQQLSAAYHVWLASPLLGEGLRFYNLPQFLSVTAPPNVIVDNLASTGVIGSLAFVFFVFVTISTLAKLPYRIGTVGLVVLSAHFVDGLFDIFWIGASSIGPMVFVGMSLGMADLNLPRAHTIPRDLAGAGAERVTGAGPLVAVRERLARPAGHDSGSALFRR